MYGLLRVPKGYLTKHELAVFQAHYCGLCHALGRCGFAGLRLATSYDGAALALFYSALQQEPVASQDERCPYFPWRKKYQAIGGYPIFDFAAKASLGLARLKFADDLADGVKGFRRLVFRRLSDYLELKAAQWPEFAETGRRQRAVEEREDCWFDELTEPTGLLLGSIAARAASACHREESNAFQVGQYLGKWIYTWDALWDFEDDQSRHRFNGLAAAYQLDCPKLNQLPQRLWRELDFVLERCVSEILRNLDALGLNRDERGRILAKLIVGAHNFHKRALVSEFLKEESCIERLPMSWQSCRTQQSSTFSGEAGQ